MVSRSDCRAVRTVRGPSATTTTAECDAARCNRGSCSSQTMLPSLELNALSLRVAEDILTTAAEDKGSEYKGVDELGTEVEGGWGLGKGA